MLVLRLPPQIEKRLVVLARRTGRTKGEVAREAIVRHIDDLEAEHRAKRRLRRRGKRVSLEELEAEFLRNEP
jgi:RHH-type rel operon transcriptional repressor/antitoxin RelB